MKTRYGISMGIFLLLFMMPITVFAVDFEVTNVQVDVYLTEDGHANVIEHHTYVFDSKFKGVTREIFPKSEASIVNFKAYENEVELVVEREEALYKIYRSGKNERLDFEFHYTIVNAVEKYEDGTQFYWTFFSEENETDYENAEIIIHPPEKTSALDYLGYGVAYDKESDKGDGVVAFSMGALAAGEGGDVRVIYASSLFPAVEMKSGEVISEVVEDRQMIQEERAAFIEAQTEMATVGKYTIPAALFSLLGLFSYMFVKRRGRKRFVHAEMDDEFVPAEKLSMPATIQYMKPLGNGPEMISAALLDLIRQQYVKQVTETSFELLTSEGANVHEIALIDLLFFKVGDGKIFTFEQLEVYTKDSKNHSSYGLALAAWRKGIRDEVKVAALYEMRVKLRVTVGLISLALTPFIFVFGHYELYWFMVPFIFICLIGIVTAAIYSPRSVEGFTMKEEWRQLQSRMKGLDLEEWEKLPVDDKYRAYIYGIGMKDARLEEMYDEFERAATRTAQQSNTGDSFYPISYNPAYAASHFQTAGQNASVSLDGSTSSGGGSSGGGGVGGSGGGSGAF